MMWMLCVVRVSGPDRQLYKLMEEATARQVHLYGSGAFNTRLARKPPCVSVSGG